MLTARPHAVQSSEIPGSWLTDPCRCADRAIGARRRMRRPRRVERQHFEHARIARVHRRSFRPATNLQRLRIFQAREERRQLRTVQRTYKPGERKRALRVVDEAGVKASLCAAPSRAERNWTTSPRGEVARSAGEGNRARRDLPPRSDLQILDSHLTERFRSQAWAAMPQPFEALPVNTASCAANAR